MFYFLQIQSSNISPSECSKDIDALFPALFCEGQHHVDENYNDLEVGPSCSFMA